MLALLDIGPLEFLIVLAAAVILFGGDLPDVARRAGTWFGRLRSAASELGRSIDAPHDVARLPDPDEPSIAPPAADRREDEPPN